jgi:hypothetical protein
MVLKICKHSLDSLQFLGTFISKLNEEFFFATVMFIKINANRQVRPRSNTIQKATLFILFSVAYTK